jgi:hypothetical protein
MVAGRWAHETNTPCECYRAEWLLYGKAAGPMRNQAMLHRSKPDAVLAFPGGKGTADMVKRAERVGIRVIRISDQPE